MLLLTVQFPALFIAFFVVLVVRELIKVRNIVTRVALFAHVFDSLDRVVIEITILPNACVWMVRLFGWEPGSRRNSVFPVFLFGP